MAENKIEKTPNKLILILLIIFTGGLGIDKIYFGRGSKESLKFFVIKLLLSFVIVGFIWNIADLIMAILDKYTLNPLDYFSKETKANLKTELNNINESINKVNDDLDSKVATESSKEEVEVKDVTSTPVESEEKVEEVTEETK